jgi:ligand-binding SRPBCC domain-containing protein
MAAHLIKSVQRIPVSLQEAWDFFSDPGNLQVITPADMGFVILSKKEEGKMYAGQILEYKVKPLAGIGLYWMTEITVVRDKEFFIDTQRKGPFTRWEHHHHFKAIDGGVEMIDTVHYKNPLWILGNLANLLFVKKRVKNIFEYRFRKTEEVLGKWPGGEEMQIEIN